MKIDLNRIKIRKVIKDYEDSAEEGAGLIMKLHEPLSNRHT
jgi:hypothetical protein